MIHLWQQQNTRLTVHQQNLSSQQHLTHQKQRLFLQVAKTVTSGSENDVFGGKNAVDGDKGTRWSSNFADDAWIYVDLGKTYSINKVVLTWEGAYGKAYKIQTSTDGKTWKTVKNVTNGKGGEETVAFNYYRC